jgi:hypothetical protein
MILFGQMDVAAPKLGPPESGQSERGARDQQ